MARYIFVTGGVVSSLGKGLSSASLAYLLQSRGIADTVTSADDAGHAGASAAGERADRGAVAR